MITRNDLRGVFTHEEVEEIMEGAVKSSVAMQLFTRLPNMSSNELKLKVVDTLPEVFWVGKSNGFKKMTKQAWDDVYIVPEELAAIIPVKERDYNDASFDLWGAIKPRLQEAIGKKFDAAVFIGDDKPESYRADILTSILSMGNIVEATDNLYTDISDAMGLVEESDYIPNHLISGVSMKKAFRNMLDKNGRPITGTEVDSLPRTYVTNGAWDKSKAQLIVGDFSQAVYSIREDVTWKVLTEATIIDPLTKEVVHALAQEDMIALRVVWSGGWAIPNPVNALQPDASKRFPFAAVKGSGEVTTGKVTFTVQDTEASGIDAKVRLGDLEKSGNETIEFDKLQYGEYLYRVTADDAPAVCGTVKLDGPTATETVTVNVPKKA